MSFSLTKHVANSRASSNCSRWFPFPAANRTLPPHLPPTIFIPNGLFLTNLLPHSCQILMRFMVHLHAKSHYISAREYVGEPNEREYYKRMFESTPSVLFYSDPPLHIYKYLFPVFSVKTGYHLGIPFIIHIQETNLYIKITCDKPTLVVQELRDLLETYVIKFH